MKQTIRSFVDMDVGKDHIHQHCRRRAARIAKEKAEILVRLPKAIRDIAWKAQTRLCTRYRSMVARQEANRRRHCDRERTGWLYLGHWQEMKLSTV